MVLLAIKRNSIWRLPIEKRVDMTKPFNPNELVARVRAMTRRQKEYGAAQDDVAEHHDLRIFAGGQRVEFEGHELPLTAVEMRLLKTLVSNAGFTLTRQDLLDKVWGAEYAGDERTVDTHVRRLRAKFQAIRAGSDEFIRTIWGVGYRVDR